MITYLLIAATILVSYLCFKDHSLFNKLSFIPYRVVKNNEWYRLITHGFVHADYTHLLVNLFTFWSFGTYMEQVFAVNGFGWIAYLALYFGGMVIASVYDIIKEKRNPNFISIGASGAVSAVLFTSIFFNPWGKILFFAVLPIPGIIFGFIYLAYCQYMAKQAGDHINHNAHFYGAVYGFVFPLLLNPGLIHSFLAHFSF